MLLYKILKIFGHGGHGGFCGGWKLGFRDCKVSNRQTKLRQVILITSLYILFMMLSFRLEHQVTEHMDKGEIETYIDLSDQMETFFSPSKTETGVSIFGSGVSREP